MGSIVLKFSLIHSFLELRLGISMSEDQTQKRIGMVVLISSVILGILALPADIHSTLQLHLPEVILLIGQFLFDLVIPCFLIYIVWEANQIVFSKSEREVSIFGWNLPRFFNIFFSIWKYFYDLGVILATVVVGSALGILATILFFEWLSKQIGFSDVLSVLFTLIMFIQVFAFTFYGISAGGAIGEKIGKEVQRL